MSKISFNEIVNNFNLTAINENFDRIATELNTKVFYRDNPVGEPNSLNNNIDVNSKQIINLAAPTNDNDAARLKDVQNAISGATSANLITFAPVGSISATNVQAAIAELAAEGSGVGSFNGRTGVVTLLNTDVNGALGYTAAPTVNPTFTGIVTVPTVTYPDNSTKAASTAFVNTAVTAIAGSAPTYTNVKDFGAVGDGVTNNNTAFTNAIIAAKASTAKSLYIPPGHYLKTIEHDVTELEVWSDPLQFGQLGGAQIITNANTPVFSIVNSHGFGMRNISITGPNNPAFTNCIGLKITDSNSVRVRDCDFYYMYDSIRQIGECFYGEFEGLQGWNHLNTFFTGTGNTNPGFDSHFSDIVVNSTTGVWAFKFTHAGSVTMDSVIITPIGMTGGSVMFDTDAPLSGVHQISNCVFEGGPVGLYLKGTVGQPIKFVMTSNTYIASSTTDPAMRVDYGHAIMTTCYFTGGGNAVKVFNSGDVTMSDCDYQVLNVVLTADPGVSGVKFSATAPTYTGGFQFVYLPFLSPSVINRVDVLGGAVGVNATPIDLPAHTIAGVRWATGSQLQGPTTFRTTGQNTPIAGAGLEMSYSTGGASSYIVSYDRDAAVYKPLNIDGSSINFRGTRMILGADDNVLIGYGASNGAYKLQVNSQIYATNATIATSDQRVKKDIAPLADGLNVVMKLKPVSFSFKPHKIHHFSVEKQVGFIAQDVETVLDGKDYIKSVVATNEDGGENLKGLAESKIIPFLVKAIQELKAEVDLLKKPV